jgi:hypothetical protein
MFLSSFKLKISFLNNFNNKPIGMIVIKYIIIITTGDTIEPSIKPNLYHKKFGNFKNLGTIKPIKTIIKLNKIIPIAYLLLI